MATSIYGIDFGTSNSVLAILDTSSNTISKTFSESSVLYFQNNSTHFIGKEATSEYLKNNMEGRLLKSIKTLLPQPNFTFTYIFGKKYTAEDLVCMMLVYLKKLGDDFLGQDIKEVVLGRPVVFSEDPIKDKLAEKRLLTAARMAGFEKIWFQYEPIAAGFLYEQSISKPELVLIGDFGGGTSDFTLMQLDKSQMHIKDRKSNILKTGGIHTGGDDFDAAIMWHRLVSHFGHGLQYESFGKMMDLPVHIYRTLCEWDQMGFLKDGKIRRQLDQFYLQTNRNPALIRLMTLIDDNLGYSLFQSIERAKIELSASDLGEIVFNQKNIELLERINRIEFDTIIQKEMDKIDLFLNDFLLKQNIQPQDIHTVFLTGGTSSIPAISELFKAKFSAEKINRGDNFTSVALGLAYSYYYLND